MKLSPEEGSSEPLSGGAYQEEVFSLPPERWGNKPSDNEDKPQEDAPTSSPVQVTDYEHISNTEEGNTVYCYNLWQDFDNQDDDSNE